MLQVYTHAGENPTLSPQSIRLLAPSFLGVLVANKSTSANEWRTNGTGNAIAVDCVTELVRSRPIVSGS